MASSLDRIGTRTVHRVTMRDGVRLALDVWLPRRRAATVPTILHQTRYLRSIRWGRLARLTGLDLFVDVSAVTRRRLVEAGYAWVDLDARGSGASEGFRPCPWYRDEVTDGAEVVDWIVGQPWSNGRVGATGVSYAGTTAEMLLVNRHPAVRACAPRFSLFDVYPDVAFPGGLHAAWFTEAWSTFNQLLDRNRYDEAVGLMARMNLAAYRAHLADHGKRLAAAALGPAEGRAVERLVAAGIGLVSDGVTHVDDADDPARALRSALDDHRENFDVHQGALGMTYRDDVGISPVEPDADIDTFSPHAHLEDIAGSGSAVLSVSGWLDGAYVHSAVKRHLNLPAERSWLLLGPWEHGGRQHVSPFDGRYATDFDHDADLIAFFDAHLKDDGARGGQYDRPRVRYFTMGEERWKTADRWPPPGLEPRTLHLGPRGLADEAPPDAGAEPYAVDPEVGTGPRSRWKALLGLAAPVGYGDRAPLARRSATWDGEPLAGPLEVTGHPVAHLWIDSDTPDAAVFVYLEDVSPDGRATYVTEGQLRALHRRVAARPPYRDVVPARTYARADAEPLVPGTPAELVIPLLPVSYRLPAGHRLRLRVACADADTFAAIPDGPRRVHLCWGPSRPSRVVVPVMPGAR